SAIPLGTTFLEAKVRLLCGDPGNGLRADPPPAGGRMAIGLIAGSLSRPVPARPTGAATREAKLRCVRLQNSPRRQMKDSTPNPDCAQRAALLNCTSRWPTSF